MKRVTTYTLILSGLLFWGISCGEDPAPIATKNVESPPSIAESTEKKGYDPILLTDMQAEELAIKTQRVESGKVTFMQRIPATVFPSPDGISEVPSPISGRVQKIWKHEGEEVQKGDPLVSIISLDLASMISDYLTANSEADYFKQQVERLKGLIGQKITTEQMLSKAESDYNRARAQKQSAESRLRAVGFNPEKLQGENPGEVDPVLTLHAPITGVINKHLIDPGQAVATNELLLDIIEPNKVLLRGYVNASDIGFISKGNRVEILHGPQDNKSEIEATVTSVNPALDEQSKSAIINVVTDIQPGTLKPGQSTVLRVKSIMQKPSVAVPQSALVYDGDTPIVFVQRSELEYEPFAVNVVRIIEGRMVLDGNLKEGMDIAVSDVFSLKALMRFDESAE